MGADGGLDGVEACAWWIVEEVLGRFREGDWFRCMLEDVVGRWCVWIGVLSKCEDRLWLLNPNGPLIGAVQHMFTFSKCVCLAYSSLKCYYYVVLEVG